MKNGGLNNDLDLMLKPMRLSVESPNYVGREKQINLFHRDFEDEVISSLNFS